MRFDFQCPWCGADSNLRGAEHGSWRFRIPCDLCERDMVLTWDGGLVVARGGASEGPQKMAASRDDDATVPVKIARITTG